VEQHRTPVRCNGHIDLDAFRAEHVHHPNTFEAIRREATVDVSPAASFVSEHSEARVGRDQLSRKSQDTFGIQFFGARSSCQPNCDGTWQSQIGVPFLSADTIADRGRFDGTSHEILR
jgi:hypothetical protein